MSKILKEIKDYRKKKLKKILNQCTEEQIKFFNRLYGSIETIKEEKIDWAIQQCERTIEKNKEKIDEN